ncbi:MAG: hypothetical protein AB7L94_44125 [Kofleriaceae bacterium]
MRTAVGMSSGFTLVGSIASALPDPVAGAGAADPLPEAGAGAGVAPG